MSPWMTALLSRSGRRLISRVDSCRGTGGPRLATQEIVKHCRFCNRRVVQVRRGHGHLFHLIIATALSWIVGVGALLWFGVWYLHARVVGWPLQCRVCRRTAGVWAMRA